jgi:CBS domain containing-hemolysin-like protein
MEILPYLPLILFLLAMEAFFSGSEMAVVSCDKLKIRRDSSEGVRGARLVESMLERPEWLLGTTLVGTNLAVVTNMILVTFLAIDGIDRGGEFYAVLVMAPVVLFWGEILPRTLFRQKADFLAPRVIYPVWAASRVFAPVLWFITAIPRVLPRASSTPEEDGVELLQREDLKLLLRLPDGGSDMPREERKMVDRLIELSGKKVDEVMIPLVDVVAVPEESTLEEAVRIMVEKGHSRLPVFRERIVNIVGLLHHFDLLLKKDLSGGIRASARPVFYVPETKQVYELLLDMKKRGHNMAIAVDEYGGATGIITVEDILEEIVGEIEDEYDPKRSLYTKIGPSAYRLDARIEIDHMNERFQLDLPAGSYETLGGLLMSHIGRIPEEGEVLRLENLVFTVEEATPRSIRKVRLDIR